MKNKNKSAAVKLEPGKTITGNLPLKEGMFAYGLKKKSYQEYIAARCLLLNNHLEQAATLSNTCLEKLMKAGLITCNGNFTTKHNTPLLLKEFTHSFPIIGSQIKPAYLKRLNMIHDLRYFDDLNRIKTLNYFISRNFYLAELDYSFSVLDAAITINWGSAPERKSLRQIALEKRDPSFMKENYLALGIRKDQIFEGNDYVECYITMPHYDMVTCVVKGKMNDFYNNFEREGFQVTKNDDGRYHMTVLPPPRTDLHVVNVVAGTIPE